MGHRIEEVRPALVALETDKKYLPELKRLELKAVDNNASGVTYGKMTVSGHKGIEEIVFPKETKSIEGGAIEKCPNLKVAYIPTGVTFSKSAFTGVHADFEIVYTE
jgi:predicted flavoprotein YhiN